MRRGFCFRKVGRYATIVVLTWGVILSSRLTGPTVHAQKPKPFSEQEIVRLLKGDVTPKRVAELARDRKIDFQITPEVEKELRRAGATNSLLSALRTAAPPSGGQAAVGSVGSGTLTGAIARNHNELWELAQKTNRDYFEFQLPREGARQNIGSLQVQLVHTDAEHNLFTMNLYFDGKVSQRSNEAIDEPVVFYMRNAASALILVANKVGKNSVGGYISAPKGFFPNATSVLAKTASTSPFENRIATPAPAPLATLLVEGTPGAHVYLDDVPVGTTSPEGGLKLPNLPPGPHKVRLSLDGYKDAERSVDLPTGQTQMISVSLQPLKVARSPEPTAATQSGTTVPGALSQYTVPAGTFRGFSVDSLTRSWRDRLGLGRTTVGVVITALPPTAAEAGLQPGMVIENVNHHPVSSEADFRMLTAHAQGQTLLRIFYEGRSTWLVYQPSPPHHKKKRKTLIGVVSDSACGVKHSRASRQAAECVSKCVAGGARYVLVSRGKIYQIEPQDQFSNFAGMKIKVTGTTEGGLVNADSVLLVR